MGLLDSIKAWVTMESPQELQVRDTSIDDFVQRLNASRQSVFRPNTVRDAMSVPAIFRSVAIIANTVGALSLEAWRNGVKLAPEDRPRIIVRPDPFRRPREFFRDTAYNMATRGEAWWWAAKRDVDGSAMSLLNIPPREIAVTEDERDLRFPIIEWRGKRMPNEDMIQITFLQEPGDLRGKGPLQMCDAAVSVSVEAQDWAANFYADGGGPGITIKSARELDPTLDDNGLSEADHLRAQWIDRHNNGTRVIDPGIESVEYQAPNEAGAQMLESRMFNVGDAVRMLGVPGTILSYGTPGSSLTYQNVGQELDKFTRITLWPDYLEGIEQAISDLLTRSTTARFNTAALYRADEKTRYEVHAIAITNQIYDAEYAAQLEGLAPGDVERAPVPFAAPQAIPTSLPFQTRSDRSGEIRCSCGSLLAEYALPPYRFRCRKCKAVTEQGPLQNRATETVEPVVNVNFPPDFVRIDAPVTVNQPDIHVEPTFNAPEAAPLTVQVESPNTERELAAVSGQIDALGEDLGRLAGQGVSDTEALQARIDELAVKQAEFAAKLDTPRKPRRYVPRRGDDGVIQSFDEVPAA